MRMDGQHKISNDAWKLITYCEYRGQECRKTITSDQTHSIQ